MSEESAPKSRSQRKRDMLARQKLGERLVRLSVDQLQRIAMPEELHEAVIFAKSIKKRGARRRQMQYIGVLMRRVDVEPIQAGLDRLFEEPLQEKDRHRRIAAWRDRLIAEEAGAINEFLQRWPQADPQRVRQLVRNAVKEKSCNLPPKSARALFRYLVSLQQE